MSTPAFADQRSAWRRCPVDDVGYIDAAALLAIDDTELRQTVDRMRQVRYDPNGVRNYGNAWRRTLGLDEPAHGIAIDYGCGIGIEAVELAACGWDVIVADINETTVSLATRVMRLYGYRPGAAVVISEDQTVPITHGRLDLFHCNGVLHHCPEPRRVMAEAHALLRPGGKARLMLYSDLGWRWATRTEPPFEVTTHPQFRRFIRAFDEIGEYADWYDRVRLVERFGDLFTVEAFDYILADGRYCTATLGRKP